MSDPHRILIVDDDRDILTAARLLLERHFDQVVTSHDPERIPEITTPTELDGSEPIGDPPPGFATWREWTAGTPKTPDSPSTPPACCRAGKRSTTPPGSVELSDMLPDFSRCLNEKLTYSLAGRSSPP